MHWHWRAGEGDHNGQHVILSAADIEIHLREACAGRPCARGHAAARPQKVKRDLGPELALNGPSSHAVKRALGWEHPLDHPGPIAVDAPIGGKGPGPRLGPKLGPRRGPQTVAPDWSPGPETRAQDPGQTLSSRHGT